MADTFLRMRLFVAVYEERSFTAAAIRENATQSGVTQHIRKLEDQFGVALFLRGAAKVTPTPAGDRYYQDCIEVLRAHQRSRHNLQAHGAGMSGEVRIGLSPTMTRCAVAPALSAFMRSHPNVTVRITDAYSDIIVAMVRAGELDVGVVPAFTPEPSMRSTLFARTAQFLVSGRASGLGLEHRKPVALGQLGPLKLVLPSRLQLRRHLIDMYLASVGAQIAQRLEIDSSLTAYDFVARTDWLSIHAGIAMMHEYDGDLLVVNPITSPALVLDLFQIERSRDPISPVSTAFMEVLRAETRKLQQRTLNLVGEA
jgi:LysR family nitrogen assimilation transcriptional regulator